MRLENVLPALREGKKVRRRVWGDKIWLVIRQMSSPSDPILDLTNASGQRYHVVGTYDLLADDWQLVKEEE